MDKILVVNGPNINMLGIRELDKYGQTSYQELKGIIQNHSVNKFHIEIYQSNVEGEIVSKIHNMIDEDFDGLIINPGAYTQIAVAIGAPTLYYYCTNHSGMGGQANTPS